MGNLEDDQRAGGSDPEAIEKIRILTRTAESLVQPGSVVELRVLNSPRGTGSGYYDNLKDLVRDADLNDGIGSGVYLTLNPVHLDLLARATNRFRWYVKGGDSTGDDHVLHRRWLYIDCDPRRPSGISATDEQHAVALRTAEDMRTGLRAEGWPEPIVGDSGNGAHLLYRIDLPNDVSHTALLRKCLAALAFRFDNYAVVIDKGTFNAARLGRFYGTLNKKGDASADRPHRRSALLEVPPTIEVVPTRLLEALAAYSDSGESRMRGDVHAGLNGFDLDEWILAHSVPVVSHGPWGEGGEKYVLGVCPWNEAHTNRSAFIIRFRGGAIAGGCLHDSCRTKRWRDLRRAYEPGFAETPSDLAQATRRALETANESIDAVAAVIEQIPTDISRLQLHEALRPVLDALAGLESARAEAYLTGEIGSRFKLKALEIAAYRREINERRKQLHSEDSAKGQGDAPRYTAIIPGLVDLVEDDGQVAFLMKTAEGLIVTLEVERDGTRFVPPPRDKIPWLLPRASKVKDYYELQDLLPAGEAERALLDDLMRYHERISELPGEGYYLLLAAWDMHTYVLETFQYTPIVCLFAIPERGKSRTGKACIYVAYRGIHVESLRDAYLVRVANDLHASIFFDVKDIWKKAEANGSEDILLHRFERGATVPRVLYPERGAHQDIVYYQIFGPTIIATNEAVNRILETRAVSIVMPETAMTFEEDVTAEAALPLKERLLAFRARYLDQPLPDCPKPAAGRLGDILRPLLQVIRLTDRTKEAVFVDLVRELERSRLVAKAESFEGDVLRAVLAVRDRVERGILPQAVIVGQINEGRPEKHRFTPQRVGRLLASLGFAKGKNATGASAVVWDEAQFTRMCLKYGLGKSSETPDTSGTQATGGEVSDLPGVSDDPGETPPEDIQ